ncbi:MAG: 1-acyl-sn-glycerol-3-phosphate acyltransferase, partial [bacterium]
FWPLGPLLRGGGAFFVRRSFAGDRLYKMVFHRYLATLIREGYTLEFFIEGGRSRTGKMLTPKLGVLASIVGAFLQGVRRDLYLVPVSIHYGRIAEENAYDAELGGDQGAGVDRWLVAGTFGAQAAPRYRLCELRRAGLVARYARREFRPLRGVRR